MDPKCNHMGPFKRGRQGHPRGKAMEAERFKKRYIFGFEAAEKGHESRNARNIHHTWDTVYYRIRYKIIQVMYL